LKVLDYAKGTNKSARFGKFGPFSIWFASIYVTGSRKHLLKRLQLWTFLPPKPIMATLGAHACENLFKTVLQDKRLFLRQKKSTTFFHARISRSGIGHGPLKLRTVHFGDITIIYESKVSEQNIFPWLKGTIESRPHTEFQINCSFK
jgi:hypothetical protein